ncbi:MAG: lamin tail domain-containing protein [Candidatus Marinimicrobia bacterium]|jgi:hypothetical protein|nr:lamin tail domain-containing protein [Candidatus Neomarinimicrobiota bacterium]MDP6593444.1 lamin tail domain-containing protein [Candidatus Neomarinimicrobiota bacterium]MDP6836523.1 lamin tail domain-containing protein [Candidatus Neomarinimicrobiota bacterium]|tara:strand:- start:564 stop:2228 length:1665 start_codon:yes stop_codon:yes gene_type:complete
MKQSVTLFLLSVPLGGQILISEIMFDLDGTDSPNEFVEIFNSSLSESIDLAGWTISDRSSQDELTDAGTGMLLLPGSYAVILEGDYEMEGGLYQGIIPDTVLVLKVDDNSIGNQLSSSDSLFLISASNDTVDSQGWADIFRPGYSLERKRFDRPSVASNWTISIDSLGSPGYLNSVTPPDIDVTLDSATVTHNPLFPFPDEEILLSIPVYNEGMQPISGTVSVIEMGEHLTASPFEEIADADSIELRMTLPPLTSGIHTLQIVAETESDGNRGNDAVEHEIIVRYNKRVLTLNEFHYAPGSDVPEFIEIVNLSDNVIDLAGWGFSDADTSKIRLMPQYSLPSEGYAVLTEDSMVNWALPPDANTLFSPDGFPSLNNSGDAIYLFDPAAAVADSLIYTPEWGGAGYRSVEKLNPTLDSSVRSNWGTCVAEGKMTAGVQNSIFLESLPATGSVLLEPNPFSPDGDGHDDLLYISYHLPFTQANVSILIFDRLGRSVRMLANNLASGSQGTLNWDGLTDSGERARIGIYILKVSAVEANSRRNAEWVKTMVLAEPLR